MEMRDDQGCSLPAMPTQTMATGGEDALGASPAVVDDSAMVY